MKDVVQGFGFSIFDFQFWRDAGKGIVVHAGESQSARNVREAILKLKPHRIAHGVQVPDEDPELLDICKDKNICFDIAITSNIYTGVAKSGHDHPARKMPFRST